ncbi:unnamed protein product [Linum trigynum]|uniref:GRF-type domain-containing protein n=1 Tax=Linum trigynum TaxID=586398 RepID=A0AAV2FPD5_9ROSI
MSARSSSARKGCAGDGSAKEGSFSSTNANNDSVPRCDHKVPCIVNKSGTSRNPGRQFYCRPYWKTEDCRFFIWVDVYEMQIRNGSWG